MEAYERVARAAVAEAGDVLRATWKGVKNVHHKGAVDLVTDVDHRVEALIVAHLHRAFPDHLVVAEEASSTASLAPPPVGSHVWYVDPLDGTTNFAHAYPHFSISLALARGAELLFGLVYDPMRDETFIAHKGRGARLNGEGIRVSSVGTLDDALVATGFPYDRRLHLDRYLGFFSDFVRLAQGVRRNGSAALDLCYVACGRLDGFWEWKLKPWDVAAGALIAQEAGGVVSDFRGDALTLYGEQTLASNGLVHGAMVATLAARIAGTGSR